jgi:hypothetical protein
MLMPPETTLRTLSFVPKKGHRTFSVNLKMVDVGELWQIAKDMGFQPELIHLRYADETPQVHALLWEGALGDQPSDLEDHYDALAEMIDPDAIYFAAGRSRSESQEWTCRT